MKDGQEIPFGDLKFERVTDAIVSVTPHWVQVVGTDSNGHEIVVEFSPYQGIKITSIDCFPGFPEGFRGDVGKISQLATSTWLSELRRALKENDYTADFLDSSRHFILPTEDAIIEIVASRWTIAPAPKPEPA